MEVPAQRESAATYAGSGVDVAASDELVARMRTAAATTRRPGSMGAIGGFAGLFALDVARYRRPVLVSSTDGVGTKLLVAKATQRYDTVGIDLVAMCVDDVVCTGAEPLFLLDYVAVGRLDPARVETIVAGVARGCVLAGCTLAGGETAEHPGAMEADDVDLAGFAVGVVEGGSELGPQRVRHGDVLVGLTSPGLRSNGYSLARHVLLERAGRVLDEEAWPGAGHTLADELLRPSVVYAPSVLAALRAGAGTGADADGGEGLHAGPHPGSDADTGAGSGPHGGVHACAHVTGGGLPGNVARILPPDADARIDRGAWEVPRIFEEIAAAGPVDDAEMARVFNLGIGMVLAVDASSVDAVVRALVPSLPAGCSPVVVGEVTAGSGTVRL